MRILTFIFVLFFTSSLAQSGDDGISARALIINYSLKGAVEVSGLSTGETFEWSRYVRKSWSIIMGYRAARDADGNRKRYSGTYMGGRFFPLNLGVPIYESRRANIISYTFEYMPYVELGVITGRYLQQTIDALGSAERSADFNGGFSGFGMFWLFSDLWVADFNVGYELEIGTGGGVLSGQTSMLQVGLLRYF